MDDNENEMVDLLVPDVSVNVDESPVTIVTENGVTDNQVDVIDLEDDSSKDVIETNPESTNVCETSSEVINTCETYSEPTNIIENTYSESADIIENTCSESAIIIENTYCESANNVENENPLQNGVTEENEIAVMNEDPVQIENHIETVNPGQIPDPFTLEEAMAHENLFGEGHQAIQFLRIHCTACNTHLGSAPRNQNNRFIHPLLKVLICKKCFDFYGSGDFDKDEDGSELYCRWCGQGGKVLCCARCPYVFCQRCIRVNFGKRKLASVQASDDWLCFVCVPENVMKLRVMCRALYDYVQQQIRLSEELNQPDRLKVDFSMCCQNKPIPGKRKLSGVDTPVEVNGEDTVNKKKKIKLKVLPQMSIMTNENRFGLNEWGSEVIEDEVVCTPDLSLLMGSEESFHSPTASPQHEFQQPSSSMDFQEIPPPPLVLYSNSNTEMLNGDDADVQFIAPSKYQQTKVYTNKTSQFNRGYTLPSKPPTIINKNAKKQLNSNLIKFQNPPFKIMTKDKPITGVTHNRNTSTVDTTLSTKLMPGLKYDWFNKASQLTAKVNQNLSSKLCTLSQEQNSVESLEKLAGIHNSLQEVLSNSINSLMQIRKNLRADFLNGLKSLKFCMTPSKPTTVEDNDVIIVDSNSNSKAPQNLNAKRSFIKLKKPEQLLQSPVITIADDVINIEKDASTNARNKINEYRGHNKVTRSSNPSVILNTDMTKEIRRAFYESNFKSIVNENHKIPANDIDHELKEQMLAVRVLVEKNFGSTTPKTKPCKGYKAMTNFSVEEQDTENEFSTNITREENNQDTQLPVVNGSADGVVTIPDDEDLSQDLQTTDSGIDVDGEQNLNSEIIHL